MACGLPGLMSTNAVNSVQVVFNPHVDEQAAAQAACAYAEVPAPNLLRRRSRSPGQGDKSKAYEACVDEQPPSFAITRAGARELRRQEEAADDTSETSPPPPLQRKPQRKKSGLHLGEVDGSDAVPGVPDFDIYPECLREGPWSPAAYLYLAGIIAWILWSSGEALEDMGKLNIQESSLATRALLGVLAGYTTAIQFGMLRSVGAWPYASYTMISYSTITVRFALVALGLASAAEVLRFPMLVMAWTTTAVWWVLLVPAMLLCMPPDGRRVFIKFNFSWFLINVHLLNLPLAMLDHQLTWRPLSLWDFWIGMVFAIAYLIFYLLVLDANGMHFYIILSPRRAWCCLPGYSSVLLVYLSIYCMLG